MKNIFLIVLFFVFLLSLVLMIVIPIYKKHKDATGNIVNFDLTMRKFVYKTSLAKTQIYEQLSVKNVLDELDYTFDENTDEIQFKGFGSNVTYELVIDECDEFSILRVNQISIITMQSHIPYQMNPFWVKKLDAEIIPFAKFGI